MLKPLFLICVSVTLISAQRNITFKNVKIKGFSMYVEKFSQTVQEAETLKKAIPKGKIFDKIEIRHQYVPVLFENAVSDMDLDELILEKCNITRIAPGAFSGVSLLRKVVITGNDIGKIEDGVFNGLNIGTLDLSKNNVGSISPGAFDNMPELLNINLQDNFIKVWDKGWFVDTPLLSRVSIQNNLIERLPAGAFRNLKGEKKYGSVDLTINLILSHNKLGDIDKAAFDGIDKVNNLWLDFNELSDWGPEVLAETQVNDLRLDHNKLSCLSGDLSKIFVAETTHIDDNPWDCGCLKNMDLWASENGKNVVMFYAKLHCDAERIDRKIKALNERLKELRKNEEVDQK